MNRKAIYKHKRTGDLFAIETDEQGKVLSGLLPKKWFQNLNFPETQNKSGDLVKLAEMRKQT